MNTRTAILWILTLAICAATAVAGDSQPPTVQGRVVELTDAQGFDQLTILTTGGRRMQVRLGEAGTCRGLVLDGDQVRLDLLDGVEKDGTPLAREMRVRRTGASYKFRNGTGEMNQQWTRTRARDGSCGGIPGDGIQNPKCPGTGSGGGQRGGNGGSRGGGGGGGSCGGGR